MQKIFFLIPSLDYGGSARQLFLLAWSLPRDRYQIQVVVLGSESPWSHKLRAEGIEVVSLGYTRLFDLKPLLRLRALVKAFAPTLIHVWGLPALQTLVLARVSKAYPILVSSPKISPRCQPIEKMVIRHLLKQAAFISFFSQAEAAACRRLDVSPQKIVVLTRAVRDNPTRPMNTKPVVAGILHVKEIPRLVMCVGPLDPHKGFRDAVWAFDILRFIDPDLHLVLVGEGSDRDRIKDFIAIIGGVDRVHLVGKQPEVADLLSEADVVWVPSWAEGGANVALEAMAAGRPVVASRHGSLPEVVIDGQTGLMISSRDQAALARQTRALLGQPALAGRLGEAGRQRAIKYHGVVELAKRFGDLYDTLTSSAHMEKVAR